MKGPDGKRWLLKTYDGNGDRVATELLANAVYREMGARAAPAGKLRTPSGKAALAYPAVKGEVRPRVFQGKRGPSARLGEHFVTDALVANWDVAGLDDDNILWDPEGNPWRLDQGGTFEFRAMGEPKAYGPIPTELESLMASPSRQGTRSMRVTRSGLRSQAREAGRRLTDARIDALVREAGFVDAEMAKRVAANMKARVRWLRRFAEGKETVTIPNLQEAARFDGLPSLQEAAIAYDWKSWLHPRDELGRFVESIVKLPVGKSLQLDSKTLVKRDKDNTIRVTRSGAIIKGFAPGEAARAALDRSVKSKDVDSVGGGTSFKDLNQYLEARGQTGVSDGLDMDGKIAFGGKKLTVGQAELQLEHLKVRASQAKASPDKYRQKAAPTIEARRDELARKVSAAKKAGGSDVPAASPAEVEAQKSVLADFPPGTAPAAKAKKFGKNEKQSVPVNPETGHSAQLKNLALEPGDKVQYKKGGWTYEYVGKVGSTYRFKDPKGKTRYFSGFKPPESVIKANQQELKLGVPAEMVAPGAKVPDPGNPQVGDVYVSTLSSGTEYKVLDVSGNKVKVGWGSMGTSASYSQDEFTALFSETSFTPKGAAPASTVSAFTPKAPAPKTHAQLVAETKGIFASAPAYTGSQSTSKFTSGTVVQTPSGKLGVIDTSVDAPSGYVGAKNVETGAAMHLKDAVPVKVAAPGTPGAYAAAQAVKAKSDGSLLSPVEKNLPKTPEEQYQAAVSAWSSKPTAEKAASILTAHQAKNEKLKLSKEQRQAIDDYTGSGYTAMNPQLRNKPGHVGKGYIEDQIIAFDGVFDKVEGLPEDMLIYRGVKGNTGKEYRDRQVGDIIRDNGYISTSVSEAVADNWAHDAQNNTILRMHLPKGTKALWVSAPSGEGQFSAQGSSEKELVLRHGIGFRVIARRVRPGGKVELAVEPTVGHK